MAYRAAKPLTLMGRQYLPGDEIPLSEIPPRSIPVLVNQRRIVEVASQDAAPPEPARRRGRPKGSKNRRPALAGVEG